MRIKFFLLFLLLSVSPSTVHRHAASTNAISSRLWREHLSTRIILYTVRSWRRPVTRTRLAWIFDYVTRPPVCETFLNFFNGKRCSTTTISRLQYFFCGRHHTFRSRPTRLYRSVYAIDFFLNAKNRFLNSTRPAWCFYFSRFEKLFDGIGMPA